MGQFDRKDNKEIYNKTITDFVQVSFLLVELFPLGMFVLKKKP